ncbi:hypothetical protein [Bacillus sp. FJAT-26390]|uniref:hypothetical protein n=1 Tax=Bacillus sp. FJAT-26390 TaxID=1743142 RepID=UPI000807ADC1|nr:hypothetical protein [Bacillus sp. FJAT-26390]OBZ13598.1 hypothetical protein A7975_12310 [Bacillus sp. FJAT-26390]
MAIYVMLVKEEENDTHVIYQFGPEEDKLGKVKLDKRTGDFEELLPVPNISRESNFYLFRAVSRLQKILKENNGVFPDTTSFAS